MVTFNHDILQQLIKEGYKYILKKQNLKLKSHEVEVVPLKKIIELRSIASFVEDKTTLFVCEINGEFADELADGVIGMKVLINR